MVSFNKEQWEQNESDDNNGKNRISWIRTAILFLCM